MLGKFWLPFAIVFNIKTVNIAPLLAAFSNRHYVVCPRFPKSALAACGTGTAPDKVEWERLSHVNLAFANPDADGNF
ncbi:MAG: hypothetical protein IPN76_33560 [Saprospiraceae bacterium]|nr:hypothetical protein [Saprospiraceae bacterium]